LKREQILRLYDRLTGLVEKLPGGLQKPILDELGPIRQLFLEGRPPRIAILGSDPAGAADLLRPLGLAPDARTASAGAWRVYSGTGDGHIEVLDASEQTAGWPARGEAPPDLFLILWGEGTDRAEDIIRQAADRLPDLAGGGGTQAALAIVRGADPAGRLAWFDALLRKDRALAGHPITGTVVEPSDASGLAEAICDHLPNPAKLEWARLTGARGAQAKIATTLLRSFTAVCGVIGTQPIPLADMPVLTAIQSAMVALIIYTSGRQLRLRVIAEFLGALGFNIGAGFLFRESARALVKVIPIWGSAVSGFVAGAGTYAIGRAAIAFFIEDRPIAEAKRLFSKLLPSSWHRGKGPQNALLPKNEGDRP